MELGNMAFGHRSLQYHVERDWKQELMAFFVDLVCGNSYGSDYECELFEIHPYWWGDCTCGADDDENETTEHTVECRFRLPNFIYKPTGYMLEWYKYPLRDSYASDDLTDLEFYQMINNCIQHYVDSSDF